MIDQHLLAGRHIEFVGDQRFDDVPRQCGVARERARHRQAPAFIRIPVFAGRANGECRHRVEKEVQPVVVVEHDRDVRPGPRQPFMDG
jgi:hypothetical protein